MTDTRTCNHSVGDNFRRQGDRLFWTCRKCGAIAVKIMPPNWDGAVAVEIRGREPLTIYL